jgi:membrane protease YdiL (CAAX protease family)
VELARIERCKMAIHQRRFSVTAFVRKHALPLYFCSAFLIAWVFWFLEPCLRGRDVLTADWFIKFGTYGPVLAAMLLSALSNSARVAAPLRLRLLAGGLVLALAIYINWSTAAWLWVTHDGPLHWTVLAIGTLLPAWVFFNAHSGLRGVQELLGSLTRWRTHPLWFLAALFLMPALSLTGVLLTSLLTGQSLGSLFDGIRSSETLKHLGLTFFGTALYGGPLGEEGGWRGFALPRLQKRFDPLLASVILAAFWGLWHLPLHLTGYYSQVFGNPLNGILLQMFSIIPLALIFTWLYNRSKGSLLVMVLLHTTVNVTSSIVTPAVGMYIITTVVVVLMVIFDRMYRKLPPSELLQTSPEL